MFKLESFAALFALETSQVCGLIVTYHMTLEAINICEKFVAHITLKATEEKYINRS